MAFRTKARRNLVAAAVSGALLATVPMSASAITASTTGASAWTSSTGKAATVKDTKADNRRAEARFQRAYLTSTTYYLRATGGYGDTASSGTGLGYSIGKITRMKACATNNNPLDSTYCSTWQY